MIAGASFELASKGLRERKINAPSTENHRGLDGLWGPCRDQQADAGRIGRATSRRSPVSRKTIIAGFIGTMIRTIGRIRNCRRFLEDRWRQGENLPSALRDLYRMLALGFI